MSVPVAIFTNVLRIFALCVVGYYQGSAVAAGTFHDVSGVMIFVVAFGLFMGLEKLLVRFFPAGDSEAPEDVGAQAPAVVGHTPRRRRPVAWAAVAVVLLASLTGGRMAIARAQEASVEGIRQQEALTFPDRIGGYTRMSDVKISEDVKRALETSNILVRNYISPQGPVAQLTIVHAGTTRRSLHFPEVCLVGNGWEIREQEVVQVGFTFHARRLVLVKGDQREAVLYWFKTGDTLTGNYFLNAFYWARNQLTFGSPTSAMFKVSMRFARGGEEEAFQVLEDFAVKLREPILTHVP
jgi:EpsI family protein